MKSGTDRYGTVAVVIHWVSALLILGLLVSGFLASEILGNVEKTAILRVHIAAGAFVLLLTVFRVGWWLFLDKKPVAMPVPAWQAKAASAVHVLFYVAILGMAASGVGMLVLSGAGPTIFGNKVSALPDFWDYPPRTPHGLGARAIIALVAFHVGAAAYHQLIKRDRLLRRMWFGRDHPPA